MNYHPTCGLWSARGRVAASILDGDGCLHPRWLSAHTESQRWDCLLYLESMFGLDIRLVIHDSMARTSPIGPIARDRGIDVLSVPDQLVTAICSAAFASCSPRRCATVLARLPGSLLRTHLRSPPANDWRQLPLF